MKKILLLVVAMLSFATSFAQSSVLLETKSTINADCPMKLDEMTTISSAQYQAGDAYFYYNYTIDEEYCPIALLKSSQEVMDMLVESTVAMLESIPDSDLLLDACIKAHADLVFRFTGDKSRESLSIIYYPKTKKAAIKR